jgi:hypothetical protein
LYIVSEKLNYLFKTIAMHLKSILLILCTVFVVQGAFAVNSAPTVKGKGEPVSITDVKVDKQVLKMEKKAIKHQKKLQRRAKVFNMIASSPIAAKALGGLNDPVDKFFWYWVIGWGASIVLGAIPGGWLVAWIPFLAGAAFGILWIIKKYG